MRRNKCDDGSGPATLPSGGPQDLSDRVEGKLSSQCTMCSFLFLDYPDFLTVDDLKKAFYSYRKVITKLQEVLLDGLARARQTILHASTFI
ncbi:hypothetical protein Trydic_g21183 [Trypoxylus dichotomus]